MEIRMPQLGESVTEGTIARWLVRPGDRVSRYQPIAEVITDKVTAEIPAPTDGVIESLEVPEGATVPVGTLIARMAVAGEEPAAGTAAGAGAGAAAGGIASGSATQAAAGGIASGSATQAAVGGVGAGAATPAAVRALAANGDLGPGGGPAAQTAGAGRVRYSPAVMRLSQEHGIDLSQIRGTGLGGRVTRRDVERYLEELRAGRASAAAPAPTPAPGAGAQADGPREAVPAAPAPAGTPVASATPLASGAPSPVGAADQRIPVGVGDQRIPVGPVRRRIAERMLQARREQPHAWTMVRADVTGLVALRNAIKDEFRAREGIELTYLPFLIKAVTESLREYPLLNSVWAGDEIVVRREINISIAVATEDAVVVPVIKNADRLSIAGLAHAIHDLATRARAGRLTLEDIQGGTFTVNNTGAFGSYLSQPILNYPQAAILTMEAITKEPVVLENDAIAIRSMVNLCLSLDHRVLDGLICGRFLQAVKRRLEAYQLGQQVV